MKYDRFGSSGHIIPRFFLVCKGCREKHTHFNKKLFSLNTLFHEGAPLPLAKNCTPLKSKMHPPPNRNCTPLTGFYQNYGSPPSKIGKCHVIPVDFFCIYADAVSDANCDFAQFQNFCLAKSKKTIPPWSLRV